MRRAQATYLLTLCGLLIFTLGGITAWGVVTYITTETAQSNAFVLLLLALVTVVGFCLYRFIRSYFFAIKTLADDARLMLNANPQHRVAETDGSNHVRQLSSLLNQFADRFDLLTSERDQEIGQARADLEDERNMLVALMAELTEGVVICNVDGQILLYNQQARELLGQQNSVNRSPDGFVGLGRSIFDLIARDKLTFALDHLQAETSAAINRASTDDERGFDVSTGFVTTVAQSRLVRLRVSPCRNHSRAFVGYIIIIENVSAEIARMDQMLTSYDLLDEAAAGFETGERAWRLEDMHVDDLLFALQSHIRQHVGVEAAVVTINELDQWLKIDSYAVLHAVAHALRNVHRQHQIADVQLALHDIDLADANQVVVTLAFHAAIDERAWSSWQDWANKLDASDATLTLNEMAVRHNGALSFPQNGVDTLHTIQLNFPTSQPLVTTATPLVFGSRPEMYDFDLFARPAPTEQIQQSLAALIYTVFDTETTGLNISASNSAERDTIISIGTLRIVNGRLLHQEAFDQLVDPQRAISPESTAIHGITPAMVANQPQLAQVLPAFHRYVADSILVAHNAAFDMRLLQLNEDEAGVHFANPVLDTLLLSTIIHPDEEDHTLESIASRLGVRVVDRHTALGDALTTAEVFLRLVPLLAEMGITTLGDAIEVSKKSYLARVQY